MQNFPKGQSPQTVTDRNTRQSLMMFLSTQTKQELTHLHLGYVLLCLPDSHLHVWSDGKPPFPYAEGQEPPERLQSSSGPSVLLREMDTAGVGGALIVQVTFAFASCATVQAIAVVVGSSKSTATRCDVHHEL